MTYYFDCKNCYCSFYNYSDDKNQNICPICGEKCKEGLIELGAVDA